MFVPFPFTVMAACVLQDGRLLFVTTTHTAACMGSWTDPFATGNRLWTWRVHSDDPLRERPTPLGPAVCTEHVHCLAALPGGTDVVVGTERRVLKLCLSTGRRWVLLVHRLGLDRPKQMLVLPDGLVLVMYFNRRCFPMLDPALGVPLTFDPPVYTNRLDPRTKKPSRYLFGGSADPETFTHDPATTPWKCIFSADQLPGLQILDIPSAGAIADLFAQFPTLPVPFFRFPVRALLRAPHDD